MHTLCCHMESDASGRQVAAEITVLPPRMKKPAGLARGGLVVSVNDAQISSVSILMAPQGHSSAQMPQPLQYS
jgi:hypothetical protein